MDVSSDGTRAHVVSFDAGTVSIVDVASGTVIATVPVGGKPQRVIFAPDGRRSYVVDNATNQLHTIDAFTNTITGTLQVAPGASMVALSPDGRRAWVSSRDSSLMTTFLTVTSSVSVDRPSPSFSDRRVGGGHGESRAPPETLQAHA